MVYRQKHNSDTETWLRKLKIHFMSNNNKKTIQNKGLWLSAVQPSRGLVSCELAPGSQAGEFWLGYLQGAELVTVHCTDRSAQRREVGCWAPGYRHRVWLVTVFCTTRSRGLLSCGCASAGLESTGNYVQNVLLLARKHHFGQNTYADVKRTSLN